ncbi:hypothetical protein GG344DRAFT_76160 [Lentinula edodes]|nr:hypothetical protein GG344DRAFT_76160 [Lentinula edodes]
MNSDLTLADLFEDQLPLSFREVRTIRMCGVSASNRQDVASHLILQMCSIHLTTLSLDLQLASAPIDYNILREWLATLIDRSPNLETLSLRFDYNFINQSTDSLQQLLNSNKFTFTRLQILILYDPNGSFDTSSLLKRHTVLRRLSYVSVPTPDRKVLHCIARHSLTNFTGWVVHATSLLDAKLCALRCITLKSCMPSAIEWYEFTAALRCYNLITVLHMRDPGGYLFRHIQSLVASVPQLQELSFVLCSHWHGWKYRNRLDIFELVLSELVHLRFFVAMINGDDERLALAFSNAIAARETNDELEEVRIYSTLADFNLDPPPLIVEWYKEGIVHRRPDIYKSEYMSLLRCYASRTV